jgi:hypothetical protein
MLVSCVNYNAFQHPCQQLCKILFVVFLQHPEVTLLANLFLLYSYLVQLSTAFIYVFARND